MEEVAKFADRILVLDQGRLLADDTAEKVLTDLELLDRLNIYPPEVTQLFIKLTKAGMQFDHIPVTLEDAEALLRTYLGQRQEVEVS